MRIFSISPIFRSAILQAVGAVAGVLLSVVLARRLGPDGSGVVAGYRNWGDLFSMVAVFGAPQAFVFYMTNHNYSARALAIFTAHFTAFISAVVAVGLLVCAAIMPAMVDQLLVWTLMGAIGIVVLLLLRGVLLGQGISLSFDLVSISPNTLALLVCIAGPWLHPGDFVHGIAISYVIAAAVATIVTMRQAPRSQAPRDLIGPSQFFSMFKYGTGVWLTQVLALAAVFVSYKALGTSSDGSEAVGLFSSSLVIYNLVQGPLGLFIPALMRHWSGRQGKAGDVASEYGLAALVGNASMILLNLGFWIGGQASVAFVFGVAFESATVSTGWLLFAAIPSFHCRLMSSVLYAHGSSRSVARGYAIRFIAVGLASAFLHHAFMDAQSAARLMAIAWAIADWIACIDMAISTRRITSISLREIAGARYR